MNYWLTTHYPHYPADEAEWYIYVRRGFESRVKDFAIGDRIAFYEVERGPDRLGKGRRPRGQKGITFIATGSGTPQAAKFQEQYATETASDFVLECRCDGHDFVHFLSRSDMFTAIGRNLNLLGLGGGAGFVGLSAEEFACIESAYIRSPRD